MWEAGCGRVCGRLPRRFPPDECVAAAGGGGSGGGGGCGGGGGGVGGAGVEAGRADGVEAGKKARLHPSTTTRPTLVHPRKNDIYTSLPSNE